jgi:hypothetical protein
MIMLANMRNSNLALPLTAKIVNPLLYVYSYIAQTSTLD